VAAVATDGTGPVVHYAVPTQREGGIWAPSGPAVAADGTVYVAAGNGAAESGAYDGSDAVIHLSADLSTRLGFFAPAGWAAENATDRDLGSTGPVLLPGGLVVIAGKDDTVYLLHGGGLGGIDGQVASLHGCAGYGGMAADQDAVFVPCSQGLERVDVTATTLTAGWRAGAAGSPVVGGGAVWALDQSSGALFAYDEATGSTLARVEVGDVTRFASPVLAGDMVFVGTEQGLVAVRVN
jgi:outer membrane protein assembly factor BamB